MGSYKSANKGSVKQVKAGSSTKISKSSHQINKSKNKSKPSKSSKKANVSLLDSLDKTANSNVNFAENLRGIGIELPKPLSQKEKLAAKREQALLVLKQRQSKQVEEYVQHKINMDTAIDELASLMSK